MSFNYLLFTALALFTFNANVSASEITRQQVPTEQQRASDTTIKRILSFGNRVVRRGNEDINRVILEGNVEQRRNLTATLENAQFRRETGLDLDKLKDLSIRTLDLNLRVFELIQTMFKWWMFRFTPR